MTQLQTILALSSTVDKKINVTLENLKENIYKLILPADTKGEEWKLPGRLGSEVVFGNLQSFNFTSLTSNCIGALSETSSSEAGYTEVRIRGRHFWTGDLSSFSTRPVSLRRFILNALPSCLPISNNHSICASLRNCLM